MNVTPAPAADEFPASGLFRDSAAVLSARAGLDELLLATLCAPGLGEPQLERLVAFVDSDRLRGGRNALERLTRGLDEEREDGTC